MALPPQVSSESLSVSALLAIDKICRRFEAELEAGRKPQIEDLLGSTPEPQRGELRRELETIQREHGQKTGHHATLAQFVQNLVASGLMTEDQVQTVLDEQPPNQQPQTGDDLASLLHRQGRLTRFQARAVYQGKTRGLVLGNYVVLDKLGRGGMGQVFKAQHRRMERVVALKMLPAAMARMPEAVKRFQREAKAAAKLSHPNIVTAHDADEAGGVHFLVMEYVEGQDLGSLVKGQGPLSIATAVDYVLQAARGLEYSHRQGVVHRDIKPSNVLVDGEGTVKVLDMGLARVESLTAGEDALTHTGQVMGTLDFMSPEQALDTRHVDGRTDIYSLGCTLYYLLTGRPPYGGDTMTKKILAHRQEPVPSLCESRPDVPAALDAAFRQMLAKDPGQRQASMAQVVAQLSRFGVTAHAGPPPLPRPVAPLAETQSVTADQVADTATGETPEISLNRPVVTPHEARSARVSDPADRRSPAIPETCGRPGGSVRRPATAPLVSEAIQRLARQDYAGVIELLGAVPAEQRSAEAEQLLKQAWDLRAEVEQLNARMNGAVRDRQYGGLRENVLARLLEIEPGNLTARDLYEHLGTYSPGEALRFDKDGTLLPADLRQGWADRLARLVYQRLTRRRATAARPRTRRPGESARGSGSGSDLPWVPLAIGLGVLAVAGLLLAIVFLLRDGDQTVRVEIDPALIRDAEVTVWLDGKQMEIAGLGETIQLKPGEHGYEIRRGDELIAAREFTVLKGDNPALRIAVETDAIAAGRATEPTPDGADSSRTTPLERAFVSLFDGSTLDGWHGDTRLWRVIDGVIVGNTKGVDFDVASYLCTRKTYRDFILKAKFRLHEGNSGIQFRSEQLPDYQAAGYQAEIGWPTAPNRPSSAIGLFFQSQQRESIWTDRRQLLQHVKDQDWNEYVITCRGPQITLELNGYTAVDFVEERPAAKAGVIGFQIRRRPQLGFSDMKVEFRDIWISELMETPRTGTAAAAATGGALRAPPVAIAPYDAVKAKEHQAAWAEHLSVPVETTNSLGMKLMLIPPGQFDMGMTEGEPTGRTVRITKPFYMGVFEVTVAQFREFVNATGHRTDAERGADGRIFDPRVRFTGANAYANQPGITWKTPGERTGDEHPVLRVSWNDADAFCRWLVQKEGRAYRLPTEAEWEYACRAGTRTIWSCGDGRRSLQEFANLCDASVQPNHFPSAAQSCPWNDGYPFTAPVGSFRPNAFGLHDMHGNLWEMCYDWFAPLGPSPVDDPSGPEAGSERVQRGGGWNTHPELCSSSFRIKHTPTWSTNTCGFRIAYNVPDK